MLHSFKNDPSHIALPEKFTYPFHYVPHPLCVTAAEEVQLFLTSQTQWEKELSKGKMFGVLVVQTMEGQIGYLAAFSGNLGKKNNYPFFVPPVYSLLDPDGFFKKVEKKISDINTRLTQMERAPEYLESQQELKIREREWRKVSVEQKQQMKIAKKNRDARRLNNPSQEELDEMIRESQQAKIRYRKLADIYKTIISSAASTIVKYNIQINRLKIRRKSQSTALQKQIFKLFQVSNSLGISKDLYTIFQETKNSFPPAGAGECAAPKLLQYAYLHQLKPIAMAEFWWGNSPKSEIRRQGYYYPACKGKCGPILQHMLQGLAVDGNPLAPATSGLLEIEILYEDEWLLVIDKPINILSVPGNENMYSVGEWAKERYPQATGPLTVHRLDMPTSGLLIIAKTKEVHKNLQAQFENQTVKKRYIALLDGTLPQDEGVIDLPICPGHLDRPRQRVSVVYGKPATTRYKVLDRSKCQTRVAFYPLTGRTHQIRVHASHHSGLDCPIVGDSLYGKPADRLYLHAEYLEFKHPVSGETVRVEKKSPF